MDAEAPDRYTDLCTGKLNTMAEEPAGSLTPELEKQIDTILRKMQDAEAIVRCTIDRHSSAWKTLETEPSEVAAKELMDAANAMASAMPVLEAATKEFDEFLESQGIDPDQLEQPIPKQKNRLWQKDLSPNVIPNDADDIETVLQRGLPKLLQHFPHSWLRRQLERGELDMRTRGIEPPFLLGNISAEPETRNRFGYGLVLAIALIERDPHFDMYEAPTLVPQIAMLCEMLPALERVEGGIDKLKELRKAPGIEVDSRIYELLVAARAAEMGRTVSFVPTQPGSTSPDLRVHDMHFPVVVECKLQSRRAEVEVRAVNLLREIRQRLHGLKQTDNSLLGDLCLQFTSSVVAIRADDVFKDLLAIWSGLNPFTTQHFSWGAAHWKHLPTDVYLPRELKAFCPLYIREVLPKYSDDSWDGFLMLVSSQYGPFAESVRMPLCVRWRLENPADETALARNVVRHLSEAIQQIPPGEAGILYIGFLDSLRPAIADRRTEVIIDSIPEFGHTKRSVIAPMAEINRLYPHVMDHGMPGLIESAIPATQDKERMLHRYFPTLVFTRGDGTDAEDS